MTSALYGWISFSRVAVTRCPGAYLAARLDLPFRCFRRFALLNGFAATCPDACFSVCVKTEFGCFCLTSVPSGGIPTKSAKPTGEKAALALLTKDASCQPPAGVGCAWLVTACVCSARSRSTKRPALKWIGTLRGSQRTHLPCLWKALRNHGQLGITMRTSRQRQENIL